MSGKIEFTRTVDGAISLSADGITRELGTALTEQKAVSLLVELVLGAGAHVTKEELVEKALEFLAGNAPEPLGGFQFPLRGVAPLNEPGVVGELRGYLNQFQGVKSRIIASQQGYILVDVEATVKGVNLRAIKDGLRSQDYKQPQPQKEELTS